MSNGNILVTYEPEFERDGIPFIVINSGFGCLFRESYVNELTWQK